jgi:septum formation protein
MAERGDLGRAQTGVRLVLASTSPQRQAILEQLRIPFEAVAPTYVEHDAPDVLPVDLVRAHAEGKARSVHADGYLTLGVDTAVLVGERMFGKPADATDAGRMLRVLSGHAHTVLSGLCLLGPGLEVILEERTEVVFRTLSEAEVAGYIASGEWRARAGGYAIQGFGGRLVERIEGDYVNVVGLPGALLIDVLGRHAPELLKARS